MFRLVNLGCFVMCLVFVFSCSGDNKNEDHSGSQRRETVATKLDSLYVEYLTSDLDVAKDSIHKSEQIIIGTSAFTKGEKCGLLVLTYGRLFLIEEYSKNLEQATRAMEKAQKWHALDFKINGGSSYKKLTRDSLRKMMLDWAKANTGGRGPKWMVSTANGQRPKQKSLGSEVHTSHK